MWLRLRQYNHKMPSHMFGFGIMCIKSKTNYKVVNT
jgi:hypothetical protein